jgi:hypothetical protein
MHRRSSSFRLGCKGSKKSLIGQLDMVAMLTTLQTVRVEAIQKLPGPGGVGFMQALDDDRYQLRRRMDMNLQLA